MKIKLYFKLCLLLCKSLSKIASLIKILSALFIFPSSKRSIFKRRHQCHPRIKKTNVFVDVKKVSNVITYFYYIYNVNKCNKILFTLEKTFKTVIHSSYNNTNKWFYLHYIYFYVFWIRLFNTFFPHFNTFYTVIVFGSNLQKQISY